jgi:hypothetical protein
MRRFDRPLRQVIKQYQLNLLIINFILENLKVYFDNLVTNINPVAKTLERWLVLCIASCVLRSKRAGSVESGGNEIN